MSRVLIDIKDHIAVVTFNRPEKMNALDKEQFLAIIDAGEQLANNASVRAVILRGEGKAFCAGQDLKCQLLQQYMVFLSVGDCRLC